MVHLPGGSHASGSTVQCTYISIPQAESTLAVILSRPRWMWGCEMGSNEHGVVGGNEAVGSALADELGDEERLLGMDLLRLALERGRTAKEAVDVCCALLETHGQGGGCEEQDKSWTYENGFMFADSNEAYIMETAGVRHWAVERVTGGQWRNISNGLSIRTDAIALSAGIQAVCLENGWWDGKAVFDWKGCVGFGGRVGTSASALALSGREAAGASFLADVQRDFRNGQLAGGDVAGWVGRAATVLRDEQSGICFRSLHGFCSTGSQISWLPTGVDSVASHLFTAASDPIVATYKRFTFPSATAGDFGSLELWREWRQVALRGGLAKAPRQVLGRQVKALEEAALRAAADGNAQTGAFAAAIATEREALRVAVGGSKK